MTETETESETETETRDKRQTDITHMNNPTALTEEK